jgi:hypothetical protein
VTAVSRRAIAVAAAALFSVAGTRGEGAPSSARVLSLHVTRAGATTVASCTLVARDDGVGAVTLYFVTAARLVASSGAPVTAIDKIIVDAATRHLVIAPDNVIVPAGTLLDLALLRATLSASDLTPPPLAFDPPAPADAFTISGVAGDGSPMDVAQLVRFRSTLLAVGDRDVSHLAGCVGAAASVPAGTFGIVTTCEPRKAPVITLLGPARGFLERHIPPLRRHLPTATSR